MIDQCSGYHDNEPETLSELKGKRGASRLARLYEQYRREFTAYAATNYNIGEEEAAEIFQESFMALYHNLSGGRLPKLTCSLRTYVFQLCKYKIQNGRCRETEISYTDLSVIMESHYSQRGAWEDRQQLVYELVCGMQEPCNELLTMFYGRRMSVKEIARAMNYGTEQVAKNRKTMCVKKLRESIASAENY